MFLCTMTLLSSESFISTSCSSAIMNRQNLSTPSPEGTTVIYSCWTYSDQDHPARGPDEHFIPTEARIGEAAECLSTGTSANVCRKAEGRASTKVEKHGVQSQRYSSDCLPPLPPPNKHKTLPNLYTPSNDNQEHTFVLPKFPPPSLQHLPQHAYIHDYKSREEGGSYLGGFQAFYLLSFSQIHFLRKSQIGQLQALPLQVLWRWHYGCRSHKFILLFVWKFEGGPSIPPTFHYCTITVTNTKGQLKAAEWMSDHSASNTGASCSILISSFWAGTLVVVHWTHCKQSGTMYIDFTSYELTSEMYGS
jgi:hypothetical protein